MTDQKSCLCSRRTLVKAALGGAAALSVPAAVSAQDEPARAAAAATGPVGFTTFVHPTTGLDVDRFDIGAASLIDAFVSLEGRRARIGNAVNLQDNDRLLDFQPYGRGRGDLKIGDGTFTAHGVTFVGKVRIGEACGTGINAIVQNARVHDGSFVGLVAQILGSNPQRLIDIPEASLVLFGARIRRQSEVAANTIPVPAPDCITAEPSLKRRITAKINAIAISAVSVAVNLDGELDTAIPRESAVLMSIWSNPAP